ncbi:MAG TPA: STAS/SEC14 domain-containing protein [Verrucomicrobia bacterium]|nr:STAS/SEC14 domain-containing protein [Verrucomicrobiota bacterium]
MNWLKKLLGKTPDKPSVTAAFRKEPNGVYALRIGGVLNKATLDNVQAVARHNIEAGAKDLKVLLFLEDFRGWKRGDDWGDLDFFARHESSIAKIAVVGEPRWEAETLLFLGAGRRHGEARFFPKHFEGKARAWLAE